MSGRVDGFNGETRESLIPVEGEALAQVDPSVGGAVEEIPAGETHEATAFAEVIEIGALRVQKLDLRLPRRQEEVVRILNFAELNRETLAFTQRFKAEPNILRIERDGAVLLNNQPYVKTPLTIDFLNTLLTTYMRRPFYLSDICEKGFYQGATQDKQARALEHLHQLCLQMRTQGIIYFRPDETLGLLPLVVKDIRGK